MKKKLFFTTMLSLLAISTAFSQIVNDKPISEIDVEYIQIVGTSKMLSNKVRIHIDFGQLNKV